MKRLLGLLLVLLVVWMPASAHGADGPVTVRVGGYINDVQQLDLQSHSYAVDMYLWFRWCKADIDPSRTFEFLNSFAHGSHAELAKRVAKRPGRRIVTDRVRTEPPAGARFSSS